MITPCDRARYLSVASTMQHFVRIRTDAHAYGMLFGIKLSAVPCLPRFSTDRLSETAANVVRFYISLGSGTDFDT